MTCDFQFLLINVAMLCNEHLFFKINIHRHKLFGWFLVYKWHADNQEYAMEQLCLVNDMHV